MCQGEILKIWPLLKNITRLWPLFQKSQINLTHCHLCSSHNNHSGHYSTMENESTLVYPHFATKHGLWKVKCFIGGAIFNPFHSFRRFSPSFNLGQNIRKQNSAFVTITMSIFNLNRSGVTIQKYPTFYTKLINIIGDLYFKLRTPHQERKYQK